MHIGGLSPKIIDNLIDTLSHALLGRQAFNSKLRV
jgi:hypothetical protein